MDACIRAKGITMSDVLDILTQKMVVQGASTIAHMTAMLYKSCRHLSDVAMSPITSFIAASILIMRYVDDIENSDNFTMFWSHHLNFTIAQHRKLAKVLLDLEMTMWRCVDFEMPVMNSYEVMEMACGV